MNITVNSYQIIRNVTCGLNWEVSITNDRQRNDYQ